MIGPVSSVHNTRNTIQRNSIIGTPERPSAATDAPAGGIPIQGGKVKQNPQIKKPAPIAARVGEGERGLTSRGRPVSPGRSMPQAARTGGGKSALPGGIGFVPVAKGKVPRVLLGGGVRGIASADMAPESLRHMPELLCSSPEAPAVQSTDGIGEKKNSKVRARDSSALTISS